MTLGSNKAQSRVLLMILGQTAGLVREGIFSSLWKIGKIRTLFYKVLCKDKHFM